MYGHANELGHFVSEITLGPSVRFVYQLSGCVSFESISIIMVTFGFSGGMFVCSNAQDCVSVDTCKCI